MRMTFSTPVTPTRERLRWVEGRRAWTSLPRSVSGSVIAVWTIPTMRARQITQVVVLWLESAVCLGLCPQRPAPRGYTAAENPVVLTALTGPAVVLKERG